MRSLKGKPETEEAPGRKLPTPMNVERKCLLDIDTETTIARTRHAEMKPCSIFVTADEFSGGLSLGIQAELPEVL